MVWSNILPLQTRGDRYRIIGLYKQVYKFCITRFKTAQDAPMIGKKNSLLIATQGSSVGISEPTPNAFIPLRAVDVEKPAEKISENA